MEEKQTLVLDSGTRVSTTWQFDGIRLGHAVSTFKELTSFSSASTTDVVRMHFGLKGDYRFTYKQLDKTFELIGSHHNIMWSQGFDMVVENKTLQLETFGIQFPREQFIQFTQNADGPVQRFAQNIIEDKNTMLADSWAPISPAIQQVIQQIIHCGYTGELKKLFLLSKSIELLVLCAEAYNEAAAKKEAFIKSIADREKIIAVRDLVNERVHCPPNLTEIAKTVGLNEYKLKRGFKETFNTTVFGYLAEQRLHLAQQYLRDTQKTAAEISIELGYATPQHFNNAFKKKFGITPALVRNNP
jgi:AraC-like DNA-binding protein